MIKSVTQIYNPFPLNTVVKLTSLLGYECNKYLTEQKLLDCYNLNLFYIMLYIKY